MKNKEKYAKEILDIACSGGVIAFNKTTNKVVPCRDLLCSDCLFDRHCYGKTIKEWCESEYVEPSVDWSKVPVDTPILVKQYYNSVWGKRYFAKYENGKIYAWNDGATSWSSDNDSNKCIRWDCAKLAE